MSKAQDKFWPMVLSLVFIAIISGGLLAVVYNITKEPISASKEAVKEEKLKLVLPQFDTLTDTVVFVDHHGTMEEKHAKIATLGGTITGYAVETQKSGYGGPIKILTGFSTDGTIIDYAILEHSETPGLGAKAGKWFKKSVPGKSANEKLSVSKDGGNIDAITAATITSKAFLKAINDASKVYKALTKSQKDKEVAHE